MPRRIRRYRPVTGDRLMRTRQRSVIAAALRPMPGRALTLLRTDSG